MKKKLLMVTVAGALVSSTALANPVAEQKDDFTLEQVVVTAQRQETKELGTPASVTVLTREDIVKTGAKTVFLGGIMADNVERIEIVKGVSSVLYGAEAMGGVVNIITKQGGIERTDISLTAGNQGYDKESISYQNDGVNFMYSKQRFGAQDRASPDRTDRGYYNNRSKGSKDNYVAFVQLNDNLSFNYMRSETDSTYGQYNSGSMCRSAARI